ncbi:MAG: hypothetical protein E7296_00535 [Lachnospiraceae bacterium]|nr:hypothetical protein [Lachnospiraceae bacterium]SDA54223.1 hypothetical protein SAMN02910368_01132 [Lachnospiraceae bacterium G11]
MTNTTREKDIGNSFVIEVKSQENYTWQGTITWVEGKKKENFRSALELMKLIDSTLGKKED